MRQKRSPWNDPQIEMIIRDIGEAARPELENILVQSFKPDSQNGMIGAAYSRVSILTWKISQKICDFLWAEFSEEGGSFFPIYSFRREPISASDRFLKIVQLSTKIFPDVVYNTYLACSQEILNVTVNYAGDEIHLSKEDAVELLSKEIWNRSNKRGKAWPSISRKSITTMIQDISRLGALELENENKDRNAEWTKFLKSNRD